ncbi:aspartate-semialdehyde dehydrogenase [Thiohalomonas denitrificans]|uniref:aspartate-semialdehyde dehydrogenase n=1 Tax=Thiohalomonas denitrificans TaxID=415747 RepID=UPI0026EA6573|nr:aspartate-semialdehyde dehydrogenase [Thiohalomonas denitrificans]
MSKAFDVAVVGATTLVGAAIIESLADRDFPVGRLFLLERGAESSYAQFRGKRVPVKDPDTFDFTDSRIVFLACDEALAVEVAPSAVEAGCIVIDASGAYGSDPDVPVIVPEVNSEAVGDFEARHILASPSSAAVILALALAPIQRQVGVTRVNVVSFHAVSGQGKAGVNELASQTAKLLNVQPVETGIFSRQIAFNILPQVGPPEPGDYNREERALMDALRRVFAAPDLGINPTAVQLPLFFGHAMAVHLETREPLSSDGLRELYRDTPGIEVSDDGEEGYPTPVTDAAESEELHVGRIRQDASHPHGLDLWIVADNIRRGGAVNSVQIAEVLVGEFL